jgi:hypothetical protein
MAKRTDSTPSITAAELKWWNELFTEFGVKFDPDTTARFAEGIIDHLKPRRRSVARAMKVSGHG